MSFRIFCGNVIIETKCPKVQLDELIQPIICFGPFWSGLSIDSLFNLRGFLGDFAHSARASLIESTRINHFNISDKFEN